MTNFNSIKVRLEPSLLIPSDLWFRFQFHKGTIRTGWRTSLPVRSVLFQFHKGTIRTELNLWVRTNPRIFQFHKGTIRTMKRYVTTLSESNFNSIKVRLELFGDDSEAVTLTFQFHKGTIRTTVLCIILHIFHNFNSIKVRLELLSSLIFAKTTVISIP